MVSSLCYDDVILECCVATMSIQRACIPQPSEQTGCRASRLQDSRPQGQSVAEQDITSTKQATGIRQEATSEAKYYLITEVNKVNVGTEATSFIFTVPLLEGEPEV